MGREIRRVPPNWEHPKEYFPRRGEGFTPLHDKTFEEAWKEWKLARTLYRMECLMPTFMAVVRKVVKVTGPKEWWWNLGKPPEDEWNEFEEIYGKKPDRCAYRPSWKKGEATWYQAYETVSEGTPVTPPFETTEELVQYLMANGDFWDQRRRQENSSLYSKQDCSPWTEEQARKFIDSEWTPSMMMIDGEVVSGRQGIVEMAKERVDA